MVTAAHDKISPTAKFVAYLRTFTDIPYSAEIAAACNAQQVFEEVVGDSLQDFLWTAPMVEMRYKSVDAALRKHLNGSRNFPNIIELASGVSPRGLIWSKAKSVTYLETDLPEILVEKMEITVEILKDEPRNNLHWLPVNVVNHDNFAAAKSFFTSGPLAVINEGLLPYLDREEKEKVARNIHRLLKERGGIWITPDISSNDRIKELVALDPNIGRVMQVISGRTGRDLQNNSFGSMEEAEQFFVDIGFKMTKWDQCELVPHLTALDKIEVDPKKLDVMMGRSKVWALEAQ